MTAAERRRTWPRGAQADRVVLWDNANIVESFPEITLPLTFSVAVDLYAAVYRRFCRAVGVPGSTVQRESPAFEQLLGLLQGRVYYNVNNWFRVLSLLPGFGRAADSLEAMMGARRPGARPDEHAVLEVAPLASRGVRLAMTARLLYLMLRLGRETARFERYTATVIARHRRTRAERKAAEPKVSDALATSRTLLVEFDALRRDALREWQTPIVNDLFLMFVHGALRRTAATWMGPEAPALVNALLAGGGISARPGDELIRIGAAISARPEWSTVVRETPSCELLRRLASDPALAPLEARIDGYLEAWADRAPRELQLERRTFREDPAALLVALRTLASEANPGAPGRATAGHVRAARREVGRRLRGRSLIGAPAGVTRLAIFSLLLRLTRQGIRRREAMRLVRGQVFGVGRRIFGDLGAALAAAGVLAAADDVHYLELAELREIAAEAWSARRARSVVRGRRARYARYASLPPLPHRLETRGPAVDPLRIVAPTSAAVSAAVPGAAARPPRAVARPSGASSDEASHEVAAAAACSWRGIGVAVGRANGRCLVVLDPTAAPSTAGRIIAARSTDPGWVPILIGAAGLVVEQGSLLSHSAIVARELGIPTVVALPGFLDHVRDGDLLELDGSTGEVRLQQTVVAA